MPKIYPVLCAACAALALPLAGRGEEGRLILTGYAARDTGIAGISWTTTQDNRGKLYFGCDEVFTFDGERWASFPVPGSYAVRAMALGRHGRLWIGAVNEVGYFDQTEQGLSAYHSLTPNLPEVARELGDVWQVFARDDGAVFVTKNAVLIWDGATFSAYASPGTRRAQAIQADGRIFVGHRESDLKALEADGLHEFIPAESLRNAGVVWMDKSQAGWLLGTTNGLFRLLDGRLTEFAPDATEFIRKNTLLSACRLPQGDICLGTLSGGMAIIGPSGSLKRVIAAEDGLLSRSVFSLFVSQDGALWATSPNGITRVALNSGVSYFDERQGLAGKPCLSEAQTGSRLLVATEGGVFGLPIGDDGSARFTALPELTARYTDLEPGPGDAIY